MDLFAEINSYIVLALFCASVIACAVTDFLWLRIPNSIVAGLLALFLYAYVTIDVNLYLLQHVIPAAVLFVIGFLLFSLGKFGGGDVKLLSVVGLWVGLVQMPAFLMVLGLSGLIVILVFSQARAPLIAGMTFAQHYLGLPNYVPKSLVVRSHLPYGVVIAVSSLVVIGSVPFFAL